jgi:hypothetical protein
MVEPLLMQRRHKDPLSSKIPEHNLERVVTSQGGNEVDFHTFGLS